MEQGAFTGVLIKILDSHINLESKRTEATLESWGVRANGWSH